MGFYGNITNTSNTTFSFDRIYSNKREMDSNVNNDGIFIGRYVLVEYDQDAAYPVVFMNKKTNKFYSSKNFDQATEIRYISGDKSDEYILTTDTSVVSGKQYYKLENNKYINVSLNGNDNPNALGLYEYVSTSDGVYKDEIVQVQEVTSDEKTGNLITIFIGFYQCEGAYDGEHAQFKQLDKDPNAEKSNYIKNFAIDERHLNGEQQKSFKGYDSTVWMKSSVTASDGKLITKYINIADLNSVVPTFDIAEDAPTMNALTPHFDADSTNVYYKLHMQTPYGFRVKQVDNGKGSDLKTQHIKATYDINNNMIGKSAEEVNADIYYNKAGFEEETSSFKENGSDIITILPSGDSGKTYKHTPVLPDNMKDTEKWDGDIQELSIRLPSIGNTISKVWDIIYDNPNGYGADGGDRNRDIEWQYRDANTFELRAEEKGGKTVDVSTVAGCINTIHNLMGQIIVGTKPEADLANKNYIYFDGVYYWKIVDKYIYSELTGEIDNTIEYYVISDVNNIFTKGTIWNNNVTIPSGVTIGTRTIQNEWKQLDLGEHFDTLHGQILKLNHVYSNSLIDSETRNENTIIGNINRLNDIITKFAELVPGEIMVIDEYGRMHSAEYSTAQEYTSKNYGKSIDGENTDSYEATEDRWINLNINTNYTNPSIKLVHNFTEVEDTITTSDKNSIINGNGINNNIDDKLRLYAPIVDSMGHVVGKNIETVTLPYGYKYIEVANDGNTPAAPDSISGTQEAISTQDTLKLTTSNKWILLDAKEENVVKFGHLLKIIAEDKEPTQNLSSEESKTITFEVYDDSFDEAGHHNGRDTKTLTMPFGYGKIKGDNGNTAATATYDELNVISGDDWINTQVSQDTVTITHTGPVIAAVETKSNIENPSFGSTFVIEDWYFDDKGHMHTLGKTHTVQFPKGNIIHPTTYSNNAEIITSLVFNPESGVISYQKDNSGTLKLTANYTNEGINSGSISGGDSLNTALAKLEKQVIKEANNRAADILKEVSDRNLAISSAISAIVDKNDDGTINKLAEVIDWINNNPSTATQMQTAIQNNTKAIENEKTRAEDIETELQDQISALGTASTKAIEDFATAQQGITIDRIATIIDATDIVNYQAEDFVSKEQYDALLEDYNNLKDLVDKLNKQLNPELETPVDGE